MPRAARTPRGRADSLHVRLVGDLVFCPLEDPADQRLVGGRGGDLAHGAAEAPLEADFSFAHSFLCMMRFS